MECEIQYISSPNPKFVALGCTTTLHNLLTDSVAMYLETKSIQSLFIVRDATGKRTFREWAMKEDSSQDLRIEMVDSHVVLFDRFQVIEALKGFYGIHVFKQKRCTGEVIFTLEAKFTNNCSGNSLVVCVFFFYLLG